MLKYTVISEWREIYLKNISEYFFVMRGFLFISFVLSLSEYSYSCFILKFSQSWTEFYVTQNWLLDVMGTYDFDALLIIFLQNPG